MSEQWKYKGEQGDPYASAGIGWTDVTVLQFLWGRPWDEVALAYVHSLRPSLLRVIVAGGLETCDARPWRVTVYLNGDNTIKKIVQEAEVAIGFVPGCRNGYELRCLLEGRPAAV